MTIYVTKNEDGKTHHFRATVINHVVDIVQGVFYNWLGKSGQGCGNMEAAQIKQKELIEEKLKEGFEIADFHETLENTVDVYDKAKWHYGGTFAQGLDQSQGFVHTGMFLGWLIDNDLMSEGFRNDHIEEIKEFKSQKLTGAQIFEQCCDGVLTLEDISERGNHFALQYFDFDTGQYLADYESILAKGLPSQYHVADTWDNYEKLKKVLDKRFTDWRKYHKK